MLCLSVLLRSSYIPVQTITDLYLSDPSLLTPLEFQIMAINMYICLCIINFWIELNYKFVCLSHIPVQTMSKAHPCSLRYVFVPNYIRVKTIMKPLAWLDVEQTLKVLPKMTSESLGHEWFIYLILFLWQVVSL